MERHCYFDILLIYIRLHEAQRGADIFRYSKAAAQASEQRHEMRD